MKFMDDIINDLINCGGNPIDLNTFALPMIDDNDLDYKLAYAECRSQLLSIPKFVRWIFGIKIPHVGVKGAWKNHYKP